MLEKRIAGEARRFPRAVGLEERFAGLLPEVLIGLGLDEFAALAAKVERYFLRSLNGVLDQLPVDKVNALLKEMRAEAEERLEALATPTATVTGRRFPNLAISVTLPKAHPLSSPCEDP